MKFGAVGLVSKIDDLRAAVSGRVLTAPDDMASFLTDWRGQWRGSALAVVQPDNTADVATTVQWCRNHRIAVVPQGGNTGLSGGSVPDASGGSIVLSLTRMKQMRAIDLINGTITVEAGCTLQEVQVWAEQSGRLFPLSLAAEGTCTIGGNLATNAGGTAVLRYGNARELCLGLEVVTAQGAVWNGLRGLRKDNSGLDLRDLFIGSEGTLAIITAAVLKLYPMPLARHVAFVAVNALENATDLLERAQVQLNTALTAFEIISYQSLALVLKHFPQARDPFEERHAWYILVEVSDLSQNAEGAVTLEHLLEHAIEDGVVVDAVVAGSLTQAEELRSLRENISEAQAHEGKCIKHDISLPISAVATFVAKCIEELAHQYPDLRPVVFGHLGDGNLHFNISPANGSDGSHLVELQAPINRLVHDMVHDSQGSISAEHGIGLLRRDELPRYKSSVELELMTLIKHALDPEGLMNPGKLLL